MRINFGINRRINLLTSLVRVAGTCRRQHAGFNNLAIGNRLILQHSITPTASSALVRMMTSAPAAAAAHCDIAADRRCRRVSACFYVLFLRLVLRDSNPFLSIRYVNKRRFASHMRLKGVLVV